MIRNSWGQNQKIAQPHYEIGKPVEVGQVIQKQTEWSQMVELERWMAE